MDPRKFERFKIKDTVIHLHSSLPQHLRPRKSRRGHFCPRLKAKILEVSRNMDMLIQICLCLAKSLWFVPPHFWNPFQRTPKSASIYNKNEQSNEILIRRLIQLVSLYLYWLTYQESNLKYWHQLSWSVWKISVDYLRTEGMAADVMVKGLLGDKHTSCVRWMNFTVE